MLFLQSNRSDRKNLGMGNLFCCIQVDQSTVAIKERFGKFDEILEPGCHCLPWCTADSNNFENLNRSLHVSLRLQQLVVRCETNSKDNVFVDVVASVQYRALADKANAAFYKLSTLHKTIIRASVPKLDLDEAFEQKNDIAKAVEDELEKAMSAYGYEIV
ncbi:hypothetical protein PTKIN_Ptkin07bG0046000 [Pterospermum kingtungense]